jgi:hypothetical protein
MAESNLENRLKELAISTLQSPSYDETNYRFQIDENALRDEIEEEIGYIPGKSAEHDIRAVRNIFALRKGRHVSRIEDAGYVFLTTNAALSRAAFNYQRVTSEGWVFSAVVTDYHLSHLAWLKSPVDAGNLSRTEILASCYATMRPHESFWRRYVEDPMFASTESFKPERKKTAVAFHAKDDLPEVRFRVFDLLRQCGDQLRFYAVVCDKFKLHDAEAAKRVAQPGYRFNENSVYDSLMRELFGKLHRLADRYEICVAKRGNSTRTEAIKTALTHAEGDFEGKFGFRRSQHEITVQQSKDNPCLQAVDYFLWALQRFYEIKWNASTGQPQLDSKTGLVIREDRFLNAVWPQVGEIHDLHFGPVHGTFFTVKNQLNLAERFPPPPLKKKKS